MVIYGGFGCDEGIHDGHVAPEVMVGGPIALIMEDDQIMIDLQKSRIDLWFRKPN